MISALEYVVETVRAMHIYISILVFISIYLYLCIYTQIYII